MAEPTTAARKMFAKMGLAMPDGSYYVRNGSVGASDLQNAIDSVGRGENAGDSGAVIRKHIMKRAAALHLSAKIPDTWNPDGSLKHEDLDEVDVFLLHFGVKGMKWGQRKGRPAGPSSDDHAAVTAIKQKIRSAGGIHAVSTDELKQVNDRLSAEANYHRLNPQSGGLDKGLAFVKKASGDVKTVLDAVETGRRVVKLADGKKSESSAA